MKKETTNSLLNVINTPADLRQLAPDQLPQVCDELRQDIIKELSTNPGHFAASLGVVELTVALHHVFNTPYDRIVWDVGHQAYGHKILTGRRDRFSTNRKLGGIRPFPSPEESEYDTFSCGHASNSISAALGMAVAARQKGEPDRHVVAVIGDGSMGGGLAFEGLNNVSSTPNNLLIILNDNDMAIDRSVGGMKQYLFNLTTSNRYNQLRFKISRLLFKMGILNEERRKALIRLGNSLKSLVAQQQNIFEGMNIRYFGPIDGHDVKNIARILRDIKDMEGPKVLHLHTTKGKGFEPAEKYPGIWHAPGRFDPKSGKRIVASSKGLPPLFQDVFGHTLVELAELNPRIVGVPPAMPSGCSMCFMMEKMPDRAFDVGIAEEHAVALASGIAANGGKPVYGVYSTFIQRSYDQLSQDLCINNNPAVLLVFWGTLSGMNDVTHLCFFDIPLISNIPNMVYLAPTCKEEYLAMLEWGIRQNEHPVAIRVPATDVISCSEPVESDYSVLNRYKVAHRGSKVAILALGSFFGLGQSVLSLLKEKAGIDATLINPRYITGIDNELMEELKADHQLVITLEDGVLDGGFGEKIARYYGASDMKVLNYGAKKEFVDRYDIQELLRANHLTDELIVEDIRKIIG